MRLDHFDDVNWEDMQHDLAKTMTHLDSRMKSVQFIMSNAVNFILVCERFNLRPLAVLQRASQIMTYLDEGHHRGKGKSVIHAMRMFMRKELRDDDEFRPHEREVAGHLEHLTNPDRG